MKGKTKILLVISFISIILICIGLQLIKKDENIDNQENKTNNLLNELNFKDTSTQAGTDGCTIVK